MTTIKFDLSINGVKVKTLEELRENLTDELVMIARSGQLGRWLNSQSLSEEAQKVDHAVMDYTGNAELFEAICAVIGVEGSKEDIAALFSPPALADPKSDAGRYQEKYEALHLVFNAALDLLIKQAFRNPKTFNRLKDKILCLLEKRDEAEEQQKKNYVFLSSEPSFLAVFALLDNDKKSVEIGQQVCVGDFFAKNRKFVAPCSGTIRAINENYALLEME